MKHIKVLYLTFICMIFFAATCNHEDENCHKSIDIINNSDDAIYFDYSLSYPDTLTLYPNPSLDPGYFKIAGHSSQNDINRDCFEGTLITNPEGKIMYFVYDATTLETTPWDTVVKYYMVLKRYDLSLEDLQGMNWTITYP